jgi:hypothetical protein
MSEHFTIAEIEVWEINGDLNTPDKTEEED